ncbi:hypothetical protein CTEN210_07360 [Chaetoceros tenuissimus]|uniref:Uncharacterized protein n=1 Tax=Chaetoceros tenuissimus TaxID=426638 RepID=A0AAD3H5P9_9STRA|nr:hypothetical protein CTEN210_07360 [Chaetoceros tenuissimus]
MGKVNPSAPPIVDAKPVDPSDASRISSTSTAPSDTSSTPYSSMTSELVGSVAEGQTIYIRAVYRTFLHRFSLFVNFFVILSAFGIAVGQIWGMAIKHTVFLETLLRSYMIGISGMIVLNEIESVTLLKSSPILYKYPWRGVFYTFFGALGTLLNDIGNDDYVNNWNRYKYNNYNNNSSGYVTFQIPSLEHFIEIFIGVTSRLLFFMGCVYFLMGILFLQSKVNRDVEEFRHRLRMCNESFGNHQDVMQRRVGGRLAEEIGMTHV